MSSNKNNSAKYTDNPYYQPKNSNFLGRRLSVVSNVPSLMTSISSINSEVSTDQHNSDQENMDEDDVWYPMEPLKTNNSTNSSFEGSMGGTEAAYASGNRVYNEQNNEESGTSRYSSTEFFEYNVLEKFSFEECIDLYNRKHTKNPILNTSLKLQTSAASSEAYNNKVTFGHLNKVEEDDIEEKASDLLLSNNSSDPSTKTCTKDF